MKPRFTIIPLAALFIAAALTPPRVDAATLGMAAAQGLVDAFYGALTATDRHAQEAQLTRVTHPNWRNCSSNDQCQDLAATLKRWGSRIESVPDMRWSQRAVFVAGDTIVVRGEAIGTPRTSFLGIAPSGASFRVMTLDTHRVRDGRIVETYHLEDWVTGLQQLSNPAPRP